MSKGNFSAVAKTSTPADPPPQPLSQVEVDTSSACNASRRENWFMPEVSELTDGGLIGASAGA